MPPRPLPVIPGVVRCSAQGVLASGQQWVNVIHWRYSAGASSPGNTEIDILHTTLVRLWLGSGFATGTAWLTGQCTSGVQLQRIVYTVLNGAAQPYEKAATGAGIVAGSSLPSECAPVLTLRTAIRGRRSRGRLFMPAPALSTCDVNGRLNSTTTNAIANQWVGLVAALVPAQWAPVVASYGHGTDHGTPTTWTPFATDITSVQMNSDVDVQRRRKN